MATMYPEEIDSIDGPTDGEIKVFKFLQEAAKPDKDFFCWYEPSIGIEGKSPDFVLLGRKFGLIAIEVKDWTLFQIKSANHLQFTVRISGEDEPRTNPDKQAKGYVYALMERLKGIPGLTSTRAGFEGKLKIPIGRMIVFANIHREEYLSSEVLPHLISPERIFFQDDLDPAGKILSDPSGRLFMERIAPAFPFKLEPLTQKEIDKLKNIIYPELIQLPTRIGSGKSHFQKEVQALDDNQARLARNLGRGIKLSRDRRDVVRL